MDAGVVSNFRPQAFAARTAAERFCYRGKAPGLVKNSRLPVARRPPQPKAARAVCGVAAPPRCTRHRVRHGSLHPIPRRSQRRLTPFFSSLLDDAGCGTVECFGDSKK